MTKDEEDELELLELENENALALKAAAAKPAPESTEPDIMSKDPGEAKRAIMKVGSELPVPGLAAVKGAMSAGGQALEDVGGAASEALGRAGVPDVVSAAVGAIPAIPGALYKAASSMVPGTVGEVSEQAAANAAGVGIGKAGLKLLPPLEARAPNIVKAVKAALSANILPSMTQITQSAPIAAVENMAAKIPFIGKRIETMRQIQDQSYNDVRNLALKAAGKSVPDSEIGAATQAAVSGALDATAAKREAELVKLHATLLKKHGPAQDLKAIGSQLDEIRMAKTDATRKQAGKLYDAVDDSIPPELDQVHDSNLKDKASKILAKYENMPSASLDSKTTKLLEDIKTGPGQRVIENAPDPFQAHDPLVMGGSSAPDAVKAMTERKAYTFKEAQTLRSTLNGLIEQEKLKVPRGQMTVEGRIYSDLKSSLDGDISSFSNGLPKGVKKEFDVATAYYRDSYKGVFANRTMSEIAKVAKDNPEDVYRLIIKPGDVSDIRRVKTAVGDAAFEPLRRRFINDLVTGADGTILRGSEINRNMSKYGMETMREVLSKDQIRQVVKYAQTREMPKFIESEIEKKLRGVIFQSHGIYRAPEDVVAKIVNGDVATVRAVKKIVGTDGMSQYKRRILEDIIGSTPEPTALPGQMPTPTALRIRKNLDAYDDNFLATVFDKKELAEIERIDDIKALLETQQRLGGNPSGTAQNIAAGVGLVGAGMLLPKAAGFVFANPVTSVSMVLGPELISRLYVSEAGRRLLIKGLDPRFAQNAAIASNMAAMLSRLELEKANEEGIKNGKKPLYLPPLNLKPFWNAKDDAETNKK